MGKKYSIEIRQNLGGNPSKDSDWALGNPFRRCLQLLGHFHPLALGDVGHQLHTTLPEESQPGSTGGWKHRLKQRGGDTKTIGSYGTGTVYLPIHEGLI